jgi:DNA-binding transcriptional regulator YdaS (Cro superfamily)
MTNKPNKPPRDEVLAGLLATPGRAQALADGLGISLQAVCQWRRVPVERVKRVSEITGATPHELRPDIF